MNDSLNVRPKTMAPFNNSLSFRPDRTIDFGVKKQYDSDEEEDDGSKHKVIIVDDVEIMKEEFVEEEIEND